MNDRKLQRNDWKSYFDQVSGRIEGRRAEVEVASLDLGDQIEGEWLRIEGLSYDSKDDVLYIHSDNIDHAIWHPREVVVTERGADLAAISVRGGDGSLHTARFREPLLLVASRAGKEASSEGPFP